MLHHSYHKILLKVPYVLVAMLVAVRREMCTLCLCAAKCACVMILIFNAHFAMHVAPCFAHFRLLRIEGCVVYNFTSMLTYSINSMV